MHVAIRFSSPPESTVGTQNERGAILVEAAFVLPVMVLFVMAIIEFGLAFKDLQTVFTATRVGARTASAEPRQFGYANDVANAVKTSLSAMPSSGWQELWVYKARANGKPDSGNFTSCTTCVRFHWDGARPGSRTQDAWPADRDGLAVRLRRCQPGARLTGRLPQGPPRHAHRASSARPRR